MVLKEGNFKICVLTSQHNLLHFYSEVSSTLRMVGQGPILRFLVMGVTRGLLLPGMSPAYAPVLYLCVSNTETLTQRRSHRHTKVSTGTYYSRKIALGFIPNTQKGVSAGDGLAQGSATFQQCSAELMLQCYIMCRHDYKIYTYTHSVYIKIIIKNIYFY